MSFFHVRLHVGALLPAGGDPAGHEQDRSAGPAAFKCIDPRGLPPPERHAVMTGIMKAQIDWIGLSLSTRVDPYSL